MSSPGGVERGRVYIRALPGTDTFSKELEAYLKKIEKTLKVELKIVLDDDAVKRSTKKAKEDVEKSAPAKLPVQAENPIDSQFRARLAAEVKKLTADLDLRVPAGIDGDRFRAQAGRQIAAIEKTLSATVPLDLGAAADLRRRLRAQLDVLQATVPPIEIEVAPDPDGVAALRANVARLATSLSGKPITFDVGIDRDRIAQITTQILSLGTALTQLGLTALAGTAAAGGIIAIGAAVASASGALAVLPAVAAGAVVPIVALTVGLQGIGDAISAADDPKKFAEALEKLSPAARETAIAFKALGPELEKVRKAVQEKLFAGLAQQVQEVAKVYLPALQAGLSGTAAELNRGAKAFADFLKQPASVADLGLIFTNVNLAMSKLAPAGASFASALRDIVAVGSDFLPGLADGIGGAAKRFAEFIAASRESGALKEFIASGLAAFGDLLTVIKNLGTALGGVFRAGQESGAGFLAVAKDISKALADFTTSAQGQEAITSFLVAARDAARALAPIIEQVALIIGNQLAPILAEVATAVGPSVVIILQALGEAIEIARPGIEAFARGFAAFLEGIAPALPALGELARVLGETLGAALEKLGPALGDLLVLIVEQLAEVLPELAPAMVDFALAAISLLEAVTPLIKPLSELAKVIFTAFADVAKRLAPVIERIATVMADALGPILPKLAEAMAKFIDAMIPIAGPLADAFLMLFEALLPILPELIDLFTTLLPVLQVFAYILAGIAVILTGLIKLLGFVVEGVGDFFDGLEDYAKDFPELLANGFEHPQKRLIQQTRGGWNEMQADVENANAGIGRVLGSLVETFGAAGVRIEDNLLGAAGSAATYRGATEQAMAGAAAAVEAGVGRQIAAWLSADDVAGSAGSAAGFAYAGGTEIGMAAAVARTRAAVLQINDILFGAADRAGNAGLATARGFADGLAAGSGVIAAAAARATAAAAAHFPSSPAKEGVFSGRGWTPYRGAALAEGFAEGILSRVQQVRAAAAALMSTASGSITVGAVTADGSAAPQGGSTVNVYGVPNQTAEQLAALVARRQAWEART